ncbi:MAG: peptide ABC transporter substrate-binding protein [Candidatus Uhrbacteria bacterium]|nr:peptide ABC transporter substrate-binding protein [Candidatus Uhrbacteria bacterium]
MWLSQMLLFNFKRLRGEVKSKAHDLTMRQVFAVRKMKGLPSWKQWKQLPGILTLTERRVLGTALAVLIVSILGWGGMYIVSHRVEIPAVGGQYTEGLVGEPQFINPLYAIQSDVDQDLTSLIYSGLMRWDAQDGFVPDLAESLVVNEDGTVYTLKIRDNAKFHNGEDVRARDVLFTINAIQNTSYRSPLADHFYNVKVVQEDDKTISFVLEKAFAPFVQYLTVGILPAGLWAEILPQNAPLAALNLQPVGSGPYEFAEFSKDKKGSIRSYTLKRNDDYYTQAPYIQELTFKFYPDAVALQEALANKNVEGASVVEYQAREDIADNRNVELIESFSLRETVLYFNQNLSTALNDLVVRQAIQKAIDKSALVNDTYRESARVIHAQILPGQIGYDETLVDTYDPSAANTLLTDAGYTQVEGSDIRLLKSSLQSEEEPGKTLHLTLTSPDLPDMRLVAEKIQSDLRAIGIEVELNLISPELIATDVIASRNFELLLAPILFEADPDPYPFWHSSQSKGSGLNLVGYSNSEVDTLLVEARALTDQTARAEKYKQFQQLLAKDAPVLYLYQSTYGYALPKKVQHPGIESIVIPSDRFADITSWYIKTKKALR